MVTLTDKKRIIVLLSDSNTYSRILIDTEKLNEIYRSLDHEDRHFILGKKFPHHIKYNL